MYHGQLLRKVKNFPAAEECFREILIAAGRELSSRTRSGNAGLQDARRAGRSLLPTTAFRGCGKRMEGRAY